MRKVLCLCLFSIAAILSWLGPAYAAAKPVKLKKNELYSLTVDGKKTTCGLIGKKWAVVSKQKAGYVLAKKASKAQKTACSRLLQKGGLKSLSQLPSTAKMVSAAGLAAASYSGEPPALPSIPEMDITNLFWRDGVIDTISSGSPTPEQCGEFFSGRSDGRSGGLNACYMTQGVGHSFEAILSESAATLCYMKNIPTKANLEAGAISLEAGTLPGNDVSKIFSVPESKARLVKVNAETPEGAEKVFLKIFSDSDNAKNGNSYRADVWFCTEGSETPRGLDRVTVKLNGAYTATSKNNEDGEQSESAVNGFLTQEHGVIAFDNSRSRKASIKNESESGFRFKADLEITGGNLIRSKTLDHDQDFLRKGYSVSRFSGASLADLRFLEGAVKAVGNDGREISGATEFRDSYYAAAPENSLLSSLSEASLDTDPFYSDDSPLSLDLSSFSCEATPDIEVNVDMLHPAITPISEICEEDRLGGMDFCRGNGIEEAEEKFFQSCNFPPEG